MPIANDRALALAKRKLREQMHAKRMALPMATMNLASQSVARHFADHPILAFAPSFAGYIAMRSEVDVRPVYDMMARYGRETSLPCILPDKSLQFRAWKPHQPLQRTTLGTEEPLADASTVLPAIVLVPLLAFDGDGYRLGYGAGYYDRTIADLRQQENSPLFFGVAYNMQEVDQVPTGEYDQPLDGIITEFGVSMFR